jgi:hypothetical protein
VLILVKYVFFRVSKAENGNQNALRFAKDSLESGLLVGRNAQAGTRNKVNLAAGRALIECGLYKGSGIDI